MPRPLAKPTPRFVEKMIAKREADREAMRVRAAVRKRDGGRCRCCGKPGFDVHHVQMRSLGGKDTETNLVTLCRACHSAVHQHALKVIGTDARSVRFEWHAALKRRTA